MGLHGIKTNLLTTGSRPIAAIATAIIGLICTASAAEGDATTALDAAFPLDTPVLVTDIRKAISAAGTGGTLKPALEAIADQASPVLVIVRVAEGEGADEAAIQADQDTNVIGTVVDNVYTGMQALLAAQGQLGVRPRILGAPGLDSQAVTTALVPIAKKLRAMIYAQAEGDTTAEAITYADNFGDRELMLIWPRFDNAFAGDTVARAMGLRAQIDATTGWHKTISNVAVAGVTALDRDITFDQSGEDSDASLLNAANIVTLIRHDGYRFWGNRTLSDEPLYAFESATRTSQVLEDQIAEGLFWAQDKPLTKVLVKDVVETVNAEFRRMVRTGQLIGARCWFDPALNEAASLTAGQLVIDYEFTAVAPMEGLQLNQRITGKYYADFSDLTV